MMISRYKTKDLHFLFSKIRRLFYDYNRISDGLLQYIDYASRGGGEKFFILHLSGQAVFL